MKKKDPNFVAKLEKAISEKYGDETIQNPKSNWDEEKEKKYLEQLKKISKQENQKKDKNEKVLKDGFLVNQKLISKSSNRICPVCEAYSFDKKDDVYMNKYDCCYKCYIQYVEAREERWQKGWRPDLKIKKQ